MRFTSPLALLLILLLPAVAALGWPGRGHGRRREIISLVLRLTLMLGLILSLAGLELRLPTDRLAVVFLLDVSDSMPETAQNLAADYIRRALSAIQPEDQAAVIVFGAEALVEQAMSNNPKLDTVISVPATNQTDLEEAIRLALALYPPGAARRMVILSDGVATTGNAAAAARLAAAAGVEMLAAPFLISPGAEVLVRSVEAPTRLLTGERFDLHLTLEATQAMPVTIRVLSQGEIIYEGLYNMAEGTHTLSLPLLASEAGFVSYQVQIIPQRDEYYQNNEVSAYVQVQGPPKILLVAPPAGEALRPGGEARPDEYSPLLNVLQAAGLAVELMRPAQLPSELPRLAEYAAIVLVDVPAAQLTNRQMLALQSYVRDLGGGLVTVGGPTAYGVGGYYRTPLEAILPLEMQIKDQERRPSLTIVFIIDHSGSMAETGGGASKLDLAKEAAIRSIELLTPGDRVGIIAFDDAASWVVEITDLSDPDTIIHAIGTIQIGGGTDILAGLQAMARVLPNDPATVKHVILLTDGGADPTGIPELVASLYNDYGITLTTVGVGRDAAPFLPQLAELGGGRYHFTADPGSIPAILTEETTLATRAYIIEEAFYPQLVHSSPILTGISQTPPLYGYVGTSARQAAQTILISHLGDPVLAAWQYGLGRAVSFTSDANGRWAQAWLGWDGFPLFWTQAVGYVLSQQSFSPLETRVELDQEEAQLIVEAAEHSPNGQVAYLNGYDMQANVVTPGGKAISLALRQVAPGRYEGAFTSTEQGAYLIRVSGQPPLSGGEPLSQTIGWVLSYSPEYRHLSANPEALYRLVSANGGRLAPENPAEVFAHTLQPVKASLPLWPALLTLCALLLPADIAVRRLVITAGDLHRLEEKIRQRLPGRKSRTVSAPPADASPQLGSLLRAKQRIHQVQSGETNLPVRPTQPGQPVPRSETSSQPPASKLPSPSGATVSLPLHPDQPSPKASLKGEESLSTTGQLLARKRARQEKKNGQ